MRISILISFLYVFTGCSPMSAPKPWEKENFSKDTLKDRCANSLLSKFDGHVYFSKEATKGGGGVAGGGCGCN